MYIELKKSTIIIFPCIISDIEKCETITSNTQRTKKPRIEDKRSWNAPLGVEALSIGNKHKKKHGAATKHIALKPPGPCPRCKDYRYWHYAKDCKSSKCRKCGKYGHKHQKCPIKKNKGIVDSEFIVGQWPWKN